MAVFLGGDPKYLYSIFLETCDPADDARVQAGKDWLAAERMAYVEKTRDAFMVPFRRADRPWRAAFLPQQLRNPEDHKLPDYIHSYPGGNNAFAHSSLVSPRLKVLIEAHQTDTDGCQFFWWRY